MTRLFPKPAAPYSVTHERSALAQTESDAAALTETILRYVAESGVAPWAVVELFGQLKRHHWDAYAVSAGIESPSPATISLAIAAYKQRIGYIEPPPQNPPHQFS
jgi:hypothetical protein